MLGLTRDLAELDRLIEARVAGMMRAGLVEEVRALAAAGLREGRTASRAIGYREALAVIDGRLTADQAEAEIALATRRLARRQLKWFRRDPRVRWLDAGDPALFERALRECLATL
jgi:tRNA dimethylallyltransferase